MRSRTEERAVPKTASALCRLRRRVSRMERKVAKREARRFWTEAAMAVMVLLAGCCCSDGGVGCWVLMW